MAAWNVRFFRLVWPGFCNMPKPEASGQCDAPLLWIVDGESMAETAPPRPGLPRARNNRWQQLDISRRLAATGVTIDSRGL